MRVTKAMKEFVQESLDKKRLEKNKEFRAAYDERKKLACEEIEKLMETVYPQINEILVKYNMTVMAKETGWSSKKEYCREIVRSVYDSAIRNEEEFDDIRNFERENHIKQEKMLKDFILECDLGIDKEEFFKKVEEMSF